MNTRARRRLLLAGSALATLAVLTACGSTGAATPSARGGSPATAPAATAAATSPAETSSSRPPVAITHIHAVARDPNSGELLLATHEGLFRHVNGELVQNGQVIDLMGFAVAPDGTYYASGHPGAGVDLPQPVGLITSTDAGRTWRVASRGGQSDFHALTAGPAAVIGFDGVLRSSTDGTTWTTRTIPAPPRTLAAAPTSGTLLATTEAGLLASSDTGSTWRPLSPPGTALLVTWADEKTIVIATTTGQLGVSSDAGATWTLNPTRIGTAEAVHARRGSDGGLEIVVVADSKVLRTLDGGTTTENLLP